MKKLTLSLLFTLSVLVCEAGGLDYPGPMPLDVNLEYQHTNIKSQKETGTSKVLFQNSDGDVLSKEEHSTATGEVYLTREFLYSNKGVLKESLHVDERKNLSLHLVKNQNSLDGKVNFADEPLELKLPLDPNLTSLGLLPNYLGNRMGELKRSHAITFYLVPPLVVAKAAREGLPAAWARIKMTARNIGFEKFKLGKKNVRAMRISLTPYDSLMASFLPKQNRKLEFLLPLKPPFYILEGKNGAQSYRLTRAEIP